MTLAKAAFEWQGFSKKQAQIMTWWQPGRPFAAKTDIVLEGAIRSGKTSAASFSFLCWAMMNFDGQDFAYTGKTIGACIRNVINPLRKMMDSESAFEYVPHPSSTEGFHFDVQAFGHQNRFWVFGGKDERSQDLIQGKTLAGVFFDEVLLMPLSFVTQAQGRTSVDGAKNWYTFNPESPNHEFYTVILSQMEATYSHLYLHLTFEDNPSLTEATKARFRAMWPKGSIFYRRNVLGERCAAEGAIYPFNWTETDAEGCPVVSRLPESFSVFGLSVDYGSRNDFHAILWGLKAGIWYIIKEYVWSGRTQGGRPPSQYIEDLALLATWGGHEVPLVFFGVDPSAAGFIDEVAASKHNRFKIVRGADNDVSKGIQNLLEMLHAGLIKIFSGCPVTIRSLSNLVYDEKAALKGIEKQVKVDDHGCLVGNTIIETARGPVQIKDVIEGDYVLTRDGYRLVTFSGMTDNSAEIYYIEFDNGAQISGTSNHPILNGDKCFIPLDTMRYGDIAWSLKRESTTGEPIGDILRPRTGAQESILDAITQRARQNTFTGMFGRITMAPGQMGRRSITKTATPPTMTYQISKPLLKAITTRPTLNNGVNDQNTQKISSFWRGYDPWRPNGISQRWAENGIENTPKRRYWLKEYILSSVSTAISRLRRKTAKPDFAQISANLHGDGGNVSTMRQNTALFVGENLGLIDMITFKPALKSVRISSPAKRSSQRAPVYNLTVEGANEFFANGILVHNSDATRYGAAEAAFYVGRRG